jgi:hypothetical protein
MNEIVNCKQLSVGKEAVMDYFKLTSWYRVVRRSMEHRSGWPVIRPRFEPGPPEHKDYTGLIVFTQG